MARGFETGSDNEKIDELQRQVDDINDSQIFSVGGNENISIDSTRGSRNAASGDAGGVRSNEPIIHNITDVDEGGTSTGVFDKINIISSMAIINHTSTPITLRFIQGPAKDGARIKITPKIGKTINVESGGNILTSSTITIADTEYYELVKYSQAETGVSGGAYKIFKIGGGGGGNVPDGTIENQHPEWNNVSSEWEAKVNLEFGATGPFADSGFIRYTNDQIMLSARNNVNTGNLELKVDASNRFDFTDSNNQIVQLQLRSQHASQPDQLFQIRQFSGTGAVTEINVPNKGMFQTDAATNIFSYDDATGLKIEGTHVINMNKNIINTIGSTQWDRTTTFTPIAIDTIGFDNSTMALKYNVALTTDIHSFQAAGELLASISRIGSNSGQLSIDAVVSNLLQANEQVFLGSAATPAPLLNGAFWRDSGTGLFQFRQNGVTVGLGGGGSQTPILQDIQYAGFDIKDISNVEFRISSTGPPLGSVPAIFHQADSLVFNTPDADNMDFRENGVNFLTMDAAVATFTVGTFQANADVVNLGIVNDQINVNGNMAMGGNIDMNTNYAQFDATTAPADPPATERRLFCDSSNNDELSVRTSSGTTVSLESPVSSSFMKVSLTANTDIVSPTTTLVLSYGTNVDSLGSDFTFTGGGIRADFTGRVMIIANTRFQAIANTGDLQITQTTTVGGVAIVGGIAGALPILTADNIARRIGSINTTAIISVTTNDLISTRIGVSGTIPFDTLRISGDAFGLSTSLTLIKF